MYSAHFIGGFITICAAIICYYPTVFYIFLFAIYSILLMLVTVAATIYIHFWLSAKNQAQYSHLPSNVLYNATCSTIFDAPQPVTNPSCLPIIFGRTVDGVLQQIIEYVLRDFLSPWLGFVVRKPKVLLDVLREDLWHGVRKLRDRAAKVDAPKVLAVDMVIRITVHLEKIRIAKNRAAESGKPLVFATSSYLVSEEKELEFLRKICEIMLIFLMPRGYSLSPLKNLLSELISYKILYPLISMITSPDYLNQRIVQHIETRLTAAAINKRTYEYAACFEEFLKIISTSQSIDELLMIRTSIVNDIMQATTMQNLQRAKGLDPDQEDNNTMSKSEMNMAIKLKQYLNQLSYAKVQCEKSLSRRGWETVSSEELNPTLMDIISSFTGRRYFTQFLESLKANNLMGFFMSVEELKQSPKSSWHQLGAEIFYTYIRAPNSEVIADKNMRKRMEAFLLGDTGPDVFYEAQKTVITILEEKYYPSFIISDYYIQLKNTMIAEEPKKLTLPIVQAANIEGSPLNEINLDTDVAIDLDDHSTYARNKLEQLEEKLENKNQALEALRTSMNPESKVLVILEKEIDWLMGEKRQLEAHLMRTEIWAENLGKWRATIQTVELTNDKDLQFIILVQTDENCKLTKDSIIGRAEEENISTGWVVLRSLANFHELHRKLRPLCQELRSLELPSTTFKVFFLKNDVTSLDRVKYQVQRYLNLVLKEAHLYQCEAVYAFLNPSSEHLKQPCSSPKKSKFSLTTLFKGSHNLDVRHDPFWGLTASRDSGEQMSQYLEANNNPMTSTEDTVKDLNDSKDSIAEPLYALMGEVFEMDGVFKWVRKSMISFVQLTYGRTINRQIRESINSLFDETMLHNYATTALTLLWPGGVLANQHNERTKEMEAVTANTAKTLLIENIPEIFSNLVGQQTAKLGAEKLFATVQEPTFNKQLLYELIEIMMIELFPEIRQLKPKQKQSLIPPPVNQKIY